MDKDTKLNNNESQSIVVKTLIIFGLICLGMIATIPFSQKPGDSAIIVVIAWLFIGAGFWLLINRNKLPKISNFRLYGPYTQVEFSQDIVKAINSDDFLIKHDLLKDSSPRRNIILGILFLVIGLILLSLIFKFGS